MKRLFSVVLLVLFLNSLLGCVKVEEKSIEDIWAIEDASEFVYELDIYICEKCAYGGKIDEINEKERVVFVARYVELEVNNGGFSQYFYNSSGDFYDEAVNALEEIGAIKTAEICQKAIDAYGETLSKDRYARMNQLERLETDEVAEMLYQCDDEFFASSEDITMLCYEYIINNKEYFSE